MAHRTLLAYKGTTAINILGLVVGIASALVILTFIRFETSFDTFHSNADKIYRVVRVSGKDMNEFRAGISYPVPVAMKNEISSLENIVSMEYFGGANVDVLDASGQTLAKYREEAGFALLQPEFFKVFDFKDTNFKWISGNPEKALVDPMSVVLTKTMAQKYFGDQDPLGRIIQFRKKYDFKVTGVVNDFPQNTDFPFTIMMSYSSLEVLAGEERLNNWFSVNDTHNTYSFFGQEPPKKKWKILRKSMLPIRRKSSMNHDIIYYKNLRMFTMTLVSEISVAEPSAGKLYGIGNRSNVSTPRGKYQLHQSFHRSVSHASKRDRLRK